MCPQNPVETVPFHKIQKYIKELNDSLGLSDCNGTPKDSKGCYRLPTDEEWELAEGDAMEITPLANIAWYWKNSGEKTHPVALKKANNYGLYDVLGNVWEWTSTRSWRNLWSSRVIRGGSWYNFAWNLRSAARFSGFPGGGSSYVGFRLVRTL